MVEDRLILLDREINANIPAFVDSKLIRLLNRQQKPLNDAKILLLGVAYERDITDMRESPTLKLITLLKRGGVEVVYDDPYVPQVVQEQDNTEIKWTT